MILKAHLLLSVVLSLLVKATNPADIVLLKKMGIHVDENAPDAEAEAKLKLAFRGDMTQRKQNCLQKLLLGNIDLAALDLNLEGLGNGMA